MTIERDLAHMRLLDNIIRKGAVGITQDDMDFILCLQIKIRNIDRGIAEVLQTLRGKEDDR